MCKYIMLGIDVHDATLVSRREESDAWGVGLCVVSFVLGDRDKSFPERSGGREASAGGMEGAQRGIRSGATPDGYDVFKRIWIGSSMKSRSVSASGSGSRRSDSSRAAPRLRREPKARLTAFLPLQ